MRKLNNRQDFNLIILPISFFIAFFIFYSSYYEIDEIVKGTGKVTPITQTQKIAHLEGGIIEHIYVTENQKVKKGDKLMKIKNLIFETSEKEKKNELALNNIKIKRLSSLIENTNFSFSVTELKNFPEIIKNEKKIFQRELLKKSEELDSLNSRISQIDYELRETEITLLNKKLERKIIIQRFVITKNLFFKKSISEKEYLDETLKKQQVETIIEELKNKIPKIKESLKEYNIQKKILISKINLNYLLELNEIKKENQSIFEHLIAMKDRNKRKIIISPINGTINKINNNTISGIIKQGEDIMEITPNISDIIIKSEILEKDRSNIWVGQPVKIDFNAYSYSDYGFLDGKIISISPDSFVKRNNNKVFYIVNIKTNSNNINGKKILSGMTANINIITGKKTIMEYIIKPIKNIKKSAFTEL